uniref:COMM domain-containing protein 1 isoform X3 n=1 Tax=Nyctereutes procyonoides TaxID=34880 RepID=UPI00244465C2|nr:COMM domain-containing protein 1 isoform X3 [Nyctereutes procyonoides]
MAKTLGLCISCNLHDKSMKWAPPPPDLITKHQAPGQPSIASADMDFNQLEAFLTAQTKKQGGITSDQAAVISKFWKNHKTKIRESLMNQSRWDSGLRGLSWRVDGKSQSRHSAQIHTPVAIMELEIGKSGQESEFLCLEFDEVKVSQLLKKLSEVEESISTLMQPA